MVKDTINRRQSYGLNGPLQDMDTLPIIASRAPLSTDVGYPVGQVWIYQDTNDVWMMTSVSAGSANWEPIGQDTGGTAPVTKYVVDADGSGDYTTVQAAVTAANSAGSDALIYIRPGTYTEDLTLYDGQTLLGSGLDTVITGVHTPPSSGTLMFQNMTLTSATDIVTSAAAGTTQITFFNCNINCTNGYTVDCANWTGTIRLIQCAESSTANGVANVAGATVLIWDSFAGAGANVLGIDGGTLSIYNSRVVCPITTAGATTMTATMGCSFASTTTLGGSSTLAASHSIWSTGASAAITQSSSGTIDLSDVTIDSSATPCIAGAGAGNISANSITFEDNAAFAGGLNQTTTGTLRCNNLTDNGVTTLNGGAANIGTDNAANAINIGLGTTARAIAIGNSAAAHTIEIGSQTGAASLLLEAGTGNFTVDGVGATVYNIGAATVAGTVTIGGTSQTGTFTLAPSDAAMQMDIANANGAKTINIGAGVDGNTISIGNGINTSAQTVNIAGGAAAADSTVNILSGVATAGTQTLNLGTGAAAKAVNIGNTTGATAVIIQSGTGNVAISSTGTGDITLDSDDTLLLDADGVLELNSSAGAINIGNDADAQNINIGTGAAARTITIGNATGATSVDIQGGTGAMNFGANAIAHTTTLGSSTGAADTTVQAGTGGLSLSAAGAVSMVPATNSAAGTSLTLNSRVGVATFTGQTPASGATLDLTITNSELGAGDGVFVTVSNKGSNDADMTLEGVITETAGTLTVHTKNNGAAALNGDVIVTFWIIN